MFHCVRNAARCCPKADSHDMPFTTILYGKERGPEPTAYAVAFARSSSFVARDQTPSLETWDGRDPFLFQDGGTDCHLLYEPDANGFADEDDDTDEGPTAQQIRTVDNLQCGRPGPASEDPSTVANEGSIRNSELIAQKQGRNGPRLEERNREFPQSAETSISVLTRMVERQNQRAGAKKKPISTKWKNRIVEGTLMQS